MLIPIIGITLVSLALIHLQNKEFCDSNYVKHDFVQLEANISRNLFGQPFVKNTLVEALRGHLNPNNRPRKPLVISMHGATGTGKNFVYRMMAESLYRLGTDSEFVLAYSAEKDFPDNNLLEYKIKRMLQAIEDKLSSCKFSLFVFDEMDKMPVELVDFAIRPFLMPRGTDVEKYSRSVFLFLSNTGSKAINHKVSELNQAYLSKRPSVMDKFKRVIDGINNVFRFLSSMGSKAVILELANAGVDRSELEIQTFRMVIEEMVLKNEGLWHSVLVKNQLIDHFIPFLPLEKFHVKQCVVAELTARGHSDEHPIGMNFARDVDNIVEKINFDKDGGSLAFSSSGCKRVRREAALYRLNPET